MARIGLLCPPVAGHLNPTLALARALTRRGHDAVCVTMPDGQDAVRAAGVEVLLVGADSHPLGTTTADLQRLSRLRGLPQLRFTLDILRRFAEVILTDLPPQLDAFDGLVVDEAAPGGASVAQAAGLPYATLAAALSFRPDPDLPPPFSSWNPPQGALPKAANRIAVAGSVRLMAPVTRALNAHRARLGLPPLTHLWEELSERLHLLTLPRALAFEGEDPVGPLRFVGPLVDPDARPPRAFPWERLDGRPLVYASMGTLQTGSSETYRRIAEACADVDAQLVLSLGGQAPAELGPLPGDPLVVGFAPQVALLARAAVFVTHAGMNSALEGLSAGVPLVMLPVGNDQPGVAARVQAAGAGLNLRTCLPRTTALRDAVQSALTEPSLRARAGEVQAELAGCPGPSGAAALVEEALALGAPQQRTAVP